MASDFVGWDPGKEAEKDEDTSPIAFPKPLDPAHTKLPRNDSRDGLPERADDDEKSAHERHKNTPSETSPAPKPNPHTPPPLSFDPWTKRTSIVLCILGLIFFDLILPCLVYYLLDTLTDLDETDVLGIACASLGIGELLELPLRGYRLVRYRNEYAPLGQTAKWAFDFFFWWYAMATVVGIVPYIMATDLDYAIEWLFLMSPGLIVGFAVATTLVSAMPFKLPVRVSSDAKGTRCKPFVYYVIEDFVAVDAHQKRPYREELRARYEASRIFRAMIWEVNMWWTVGGVLFIGGLAAITWAVAFPIAYGVSLGLLFVWIIIWSVVTLWWVKRALRMERAWFLQATSNPEFTVDRQSMMV
jgi:hypothetical protein